MIELLRQNIRLAAVIAVVVLLLVVVIILFLQWQSAEGDRANLEDNWKLADTNLKLTRVQNDLNTLQAQKDRLSAKPQFPSELPIVDLMLHVANGAPLYGVSITEVRPSASIGSETIGGRAYSAYKTQVTVTGTLSKITSFLNYIEGGPFNGIRIEDVDLRGSGGSWEGKFNIVVITQN